VADTTFEIRGQQSISCMSVTGNYIMWWRDCWTIEKIH